MSRAAQAYLSTHPLPFLSLIPQRNGQCFLIPTQKKVSSSNCKKLSGWPAWCLKFL